MKKSFVLVQATTCVALCAASHAQTVVQTITGALVGDQLGESVAIVGDVNGDGRADIALGTPFSDVGGLSSGSVRVVSGLNGSTLHMFHGLVAGDRLGESVAGVGDLDHDGFADFAAGAPLHDQFGTSSGMVRVWSGRTGAVLFTWFGDQAGDWFGTSIDGAGDVNQDGWSDVIVGAPYGKGTITSNVGEARIFSGRTGAVIRTHNSPLGVSLLGFSVAGS